ncbi:glycosyltransferase [Ningiella sp. W23]|uniref:glycosyltransferase n=1 Tax=Ningiella sp. W23 TaxID=3023715 RepID=UPI003756D077
MKLFYFPDYTQTNPYQRLLYSTFEQKEDSGAFPSEIDDAIRALSAQPDIKVIFHLHWQNVITGAMPSAHEHRIKAKKFLSKLQAFQLMGGVVIWTIHNKLPHDVKFLRAELEFHEALADAVDVILLHDESAFDVVNEQYQIRKEKVKYIAHGSYSSCYADDISLTEARTRLGIANDNFVYSFIGQLRPYKGIDTLLDASYHFMHCDNVSALIAGKPVWPYSVGSVLQKTTPFKHIQVYEEFIPDDELQIYFSASDIIVLPYDEILTSGSIFLALSFGRPIVLPKLPALSGWFAHPFVFSFNRDDASDLAQVLNQIRQIDKNDFIALGEQARAFSKTQSWIKPSKDLLDLCHRLVGKTGNTLTVNYADNSVELACSRQASNANEGDLALCVVNYFSSYELKALSQSIRLLNNPNVKLLVLDNSNDSSEYAQLCMLDGIDCLLKSQVNLGYAAGNNALIAYAKSIGFSNFGILNPDVEVPQDIFASIVKQLQESPNCIMSPLILRNDNTVSFFKSEIKNTDNTLDIEHVLDGEPADLVPTGLHPSDSLNGCALFFGESIIDKFGFIPEDYFLYFEETDWVSSMRERGAQVFVDASISIIHHKSTQSGGIPSLAYTYYLLRNALIFAKKFAYNISNTEQKYTDTFVKPWIEVLEQRAPDFTACFTAICKLAFDHGRDEVTGPVDFLGQIQRYAQSDAQQSTGFLEGRTQSRIVGWAVNDPIRKSESTQLLILNNHKLVSNEACNVVRADLKALGHNELSGFDIYIDQAFSSEKLEVLDAHTLKPLTKLPSFYSAMPKLQDFYADLEFMPNQIKAYVDGYKDGKVMGWAFDKRNPEIALELALFVNGEECAITIANRYREDLANSSENNGSCGFTFQVPPQYIQKKPLACEIKVRGRQESLFTKMMIFHTKRGFCSKNTNLPDFLKASFYQTVTPYGAFEKSKKLQHEISELKENLLAQSEAVLAQKQCLVSVIMPAYNRRYEIERALASIFAQSYQHFELLIVDDGSTDDTVERVRKAVDFHNTNKLDVKLIQLPKNSGVSAARNRGLKAASGEIITYLDTDNEWHQDYLKIVVSQYVQFPSLESVYAGQEIWYTDRYNDLSFRTNVRLVPFNRAYLENRNFIDLNVFSHTRALYQRLGGFNEQMKRLVDWELILKYTKDRPPHFVPALLTKYCFGFADNQITSVEPYEDNLAKLLRSVK